VCIAAREVGIIITELEGMDSDKSNDEREGMRREKLETGAEASVRRRATNI